VDRVLVWPQDALLYLLTEKFGIIINLDLSDDALRLARLARGNIFFGFRRDKNGKITGNNPAAEYWIRMSLDDRVKKANKQTYQYVMTKIVELPAAAARCRGVIAVSAKSEKFADGKFRQWRLAGHKIIGINPGAGNRWPLKQWTPAGYISLIKNFAKNPRMKVLLFGGPAEQELLKSLKEKFPGDRVINTGDNSLEDFFALLDLTDVLVTTDSLAMHIGLSLGKQVVAIFGPTAASEIEMYGQGIKIVTPLKCRTCYLTSCARRPSCMESISPETVISAVQKLLAKI
jgi:ADP-heptose:LPS heptosyltransferase